MADNDEPVKETIEKPEETKPAEETPPAVDKPENNEGDLKAVVEDLVGRVSSLESLASAVVTEAETDTTPGGKTPWTHRRFF